MKPALFALALLLAPAAAWGQQTAPLYEYPTELPGALPYCDEIAAGICRPHDAEGWTTKTVPYKPDDLGHPAPSDLDRAEAICQAHITRFYATMPAQPGWDPPWSDCETVHARYLAASQAAREAELEAQAAQDKADLDFVKRIANRPSTPERKAK